MNGPKVAHVSTVDLALRYLLLNQMQFIRDQGYEVAGISAPGDSIAAVEAAGIRHLPVPMTRRYSPLADLVALFKLVRVLRRERFTIVHTHTPKGGLLGQYAALLAGVPIRVHTIHGLYFPGNMKPGRRWLFVLMERVTMLFSQMNLSQNPEDIPVAIEERICRPERIELLGNGIDVTTFDPARYPPDRRREIRAKLGLDEGHRVVGIVARFVAEKGYLELCRAAQVIAAKMPEARFLFIGMVEHEKADALRPELIEEMGIGHVAQFLGHRTDVADLYAAMDVLALPSYREGFPRAPMEAAAMGIPAVVTDIRGCRQAVDDRVTGRLVPVRDSDALATALLELLEDDTTRLAYGRAARAKAEAEFDEREVFRRVVATYERLLAERAGGTTPRPSSGRRPASHASRTGADT